MRQAYDYWQNQPDCYRTSHFLGGRGKLLAPSQPGQYSPFGGRRGQKGCITTPDPPTIHPLGVFFAFTGFYFYRCAERATFTRPLPFATDFQTTLDEESARAGARALIVDRSLCLRNNATVTEILNSGWDDYITKKILPCDTLSFWLPFRVLSQSRLLHAQSEQPSALPFTRV